MGLFSFWNRNAAAGAQKSSPLTDDDDLGLDTLPQRHRARRRLIGAVVLLLAAFIVLPLVFATKPRTAADSPLVQVVGDPVRPVPPAASAPLRQTLDKGEEIVAPEKPAAVQPAVLADKPAPKVEAKPETKPEAKPEPKTDAKKDQKAAGKDGKDVKSADRKDGKTKYVVQIGAFQTESSAKNWSAKFKAMKLPTYIEHAKTPYGERWMLRAGPYGDRSAAEAAAKQIGTTGLSGKIVER